MDNRSSVARHPRPRWNPFLVCLAIAGGLPAAAGQEAPLPQSAPAATQPTTSPKDLSPELIEAWIKGLEGSTALDEEAKAQIVAQYRQAQEFVRAAQSWAQRTADFEKTQQDAPARIAGIKEELAKAPEEPQVDVPKDASLQTLEQFEAQADADLKAARELVAALEKELNQRAERRTKIPEDVAAKKRELDEVNAELATLEALEAPSEAERVRRVLLLARKGALRNEIESYERQMGSFDIRRELLTAQLDQAARQKTRAEAALQKWQQVLTDRRREEAEAAQRAARQAQREAAGKHPVVASAAKQYADWAAAYSDADLSQRIQRVDEEQQGVDARLAELLKQFESANSRLARIGLTPEIGASLRQMRTKLPDVGDLRKRMAAQRADLASMSAQLSDITDRRRELSDLDEQVRSALVKADGSLGESERKEIQEALREYLEKERKLLGEYGTSIETLQQKLYDLLPKEQALIRQTEEFETFIDERVLWIRSTSPPSMRDLAYIREAARWLVDPAHWTGLGLTIWASLRDEPTVPIIALPALLVLYLVQPRIRRRLSAEGELAAKRNCFSFKPTAKALAFTLLCFLPIPLTLAFFGWRISALLDAPDFAKAAGEALLALALPVFVLDGFRQICRPGGLAVAHFEWSERPARFLRWNIALLLLIGVPVAVVSRMIHSHDDPKWEDAFGRAAFVLINLVLAFIVHRLLRPKGVLQAHAASSSPRGPFYRLRFLWYGIGVGIPIVFIVLACLGYFYTAQQLSRRFHQSLWLIGVLIVAHAIAWRWILVSRRHLTFELARKRRAAALAKAREEAADGASVDIPEEQPVDLSSVSAQTGKLFKVAATIALVLSLWGVWGEVLPALGVLNRVELWQNTVTVTETGPEVDGVAETHSVERNEPVTLADLIVAVAVALVTVVAGKNLPGLLEISLLQRLPLNAGERFAITSVSRYLITIAGLVLAFGIIGIGWSKVQWLAAAITVGLGFGLQEIFANFVSGLIILFERPIRVGDIVTVGTTEGRVTRIRIRATTITDWDRRELIVPNKEFITSQVINWTLSDPVTRVVIPVGIAYGSDTVKARDLLMKVAHECEYVAEDPAPYAMFRGFGDSTLNFELRVYLDSRDHWVALTHDLHMAIDQEFRKANIEIAFPQRDIHVRSIEAPLSLLRRRHADKQDADAPDDRG